MYNLLVDNFFSFLDFGGVVACAISGMLAAMEKKMDFFGAFILAFVAALGGGTLRDVLINQPVIWMENVNYIYCVITVVTIGIFVRNQLHVLRKTLFLFDSIGLGVFTVIGVQKGFDLNLPPMVCVSLGLITGCFGGLIRDLMRNEVPLIFHKEVYATISLLGAVLYTVMLHFGYRSSILSFCITFLMVVLRIFVVKYKYSFPPLSLK